MSIASSEKLTVYVFNVDRGDHILIELPNGEFGIIDFYHPGIESFKFQPQNVGLAEIPALVYLKNLKNRGDKEIKIAFIHISHPDYDHTKGIETFCNWIKNENILVRNFWWFGGGLEVRDYVEAMKKVIDKMIDRSDLKEDKKSRPYIFKALDNIRYLEEIAEYVASLNNMHLVNGGVMNSYEGENIQIFNVAPPPNIIHNFTKKLLQDKFSNEVEKYAENILEQFKDEDESFEVTNQGNPRYDKNNLSSALLFEYKPFKLLFGGDVHKNTWFQSFKEYDNRAYEQTDNFPSFDAHWHKLSHHGSHNSSEFDIWKKLIALNPEIGNCHFSISAGRHKGYNHPRIKTINDIYRAFSEKEQEINFTIDLDISSTNHCTECLALRQSGKQDFSDMNYLLKYPSPPIKKKYIEEGIQAINSSKIELPIKKRSRYKEEGEESIYSSGYEIRFGQKSKRMLSALIYEFSPTEKNIKLTLGTTSKWKDTRKGSGKCSCVPHLNN